MARLRMVPGHFRGADPSVNATLSGLYARYATDLRNKRLDAAVKSALSIVEAYAPRISAWEKTATRLGKQYAATAGPAQAAAERYGEALSKTKGYGRSFREAAKPLEGYAEADEQGNVRFFPGMPKGWQDIWRKEYGADWRRARSARDIAKAEFEQAQNNQQRLYTRYTDVTGRLARLGRRSKRAYNRYEDAIDRRNAGYWPV